jgi:hypothetical protein
MAYSLLVALCLFAVPQLAGCSSQDLHAMGGRLWRHLSRQG